MFKRKFQELFQEIFPADGIITFIEDEDFITDNAALYKEEYISPFGWEKFLNIKTDEWLYSCYTGQSNVYLVYLRIKGGKYIHFREKVKSTLSETINLKKTYYKIIECLTYMTLTREQGLKIIYNDGLLKINGETRTSFFSDNIAKDDSGQE